MFSKLEELLPHVVAAAVVLRALKAQGDKPLYNTYSEDYLEVEGLLDLGCHYKNVGPQIHGSLLNKLVAKGLIVQRASERYDSWVYPLATKELVDMAIAAILTEPPLKPSLPAEIAGFRFCKIDLRDKRVLRWLLENEPAKDYELRSSSDEWLEYAHVRLAEEKEAGIAWENLMGAGDQAFRDLLPTPRLSELERSGRFEWHEIVKTKTQMVPPNRSTDESTSSLDGVLLTLGKQREKALEKLEEAQKEADLLEAAIADMGDFTRKFDAKTVWEDAPLHWISSEYDDVRELGASILREAK